MPPQKVAEPGQYGGKASPKPTVHSFNNGRAEQLQKATVRTCCFCAPLSITILDCITLQNLKLIHTFGQKYGRRSDGGTGRHAGLKILWPAMAVRVRFPLRVRRG